MKSGVFATMEIDEPARSQVLTVQQWADPRLAGESPPHVTMVGSSGAGPMPPGTPAARIRELVEPITAATAPIVVPFERPRFPFSPHVTLSFYPRLTPEMERRLMQVRVEDPARLDRIKFWLTVEPQAPTLMLELVLLGGTRN